MGIPLDPGAGGRSIGESALSVGDMIASTTSAFISGAIRAASDYPVSHTILYIGDGLVVEAIGEGVVLRSLGASIASATLAVAYRHAAVDDLKALKIKDFVGYQIGKKYNYAGVAQQGIYKACSISGNIACRWVSGKVSFKHDTFFCSELIWSAYASAGVPLSGKPVWSSPDDLPKLHLIKALDYVGHIKA
jgi:uncharacterized protein YycO